MKAKTIVTAVLLAFVVVSTVYLIAKETKAPKPAAESSSEIQGDPAAAGRAVSDRAEREDKVIVYYFHGTRRCPTCRAIESYTEETVNTAFSEEIASGKLEWYAINVEEPQNQHFTIDYQLSSSAVVLVGVKDGVEESFKSLEKTWQLVRNKPAFADYIIENTNEYLAGVKE